MLTSSSGVIDSAQDVGDSDDLYLRYVRYVNDAREAILARLLPGPHRECLLQMCTVVHREHFEARLAALRGDPDGLAQLIELLRRGFPG